MKLLRLLLPACTLVGSMSMAFAEDVAGSAGQHPVKVWGGSFGAKANAGTRGDSVAFAMVKGDTIMTRWDLIENNLLGQLNMSKTSFENTYALAGNNTSTTVLSALGGTLGEDGRLWANGGVASANQPGSVYLETASGSWLSANEMLNRSTYFAPGYVDSDRYGEFIYSVNDAAASQTNLLAWKVTGQQMKKLLVRRDHEGRYLNQDGEPVNTIDEAAFNDYVDVKVGARFIDVANGGNRDVIVIFMARVYQLTAQMNRTSVEWYGKNASAAGSYELHANIDAYKNGTGPWNTSNLVYDVQNALKTQSWTASRWNHSNAFDFDFATNIKGMDPNKSAEELAHAVAIDQSKLQTVGAAKLFFYIPDLESTSAVERSEVVTGTPYWHSPNTQKRVAISNVTGAQVNLDTDKFYANKYLLKVALNGDTLRTSPQDPAVRYDVRHGNQLVAYIYDEATRRFDYSSPQVIASIAGQVITYNYNSEWARDLINRAGYESSSKRNLDKAVTAHVGMKIHEVGNTTAGYVQMPVKLSTKRPGETEVDFEAFDVKFIRPLNVTMTNLKGVDDATTGAVTVPVTWAAQRPTSGTKFTAPYDWRLYQNPATDADWIGWYTAGDAASTVSNTWNGSNIVPDLEHMCTNYSGSHEFVRTAMSHIISTGNFSWSNDLDANGMIDKTRFTYIDNNTAVKGFDVAVPITLKYWWGELRTCPNGVDPLYVMINFNGTNGISQLPTAESAAADERVYDLSGRPVKQVAKKGIYIVGGKKVVK